MNKRQFIQEASIAMVSHPELMKWERSQRLDEAITYAEALWQKLDERGYGPTKEGDPKETRDWYNELGEKPVIAFDKAWKMFKRMGARNEAAKAWHKIEEQEYPHIHFAITKYLEQCEANGTTICHFSTWLNQKRWQGFEMKSSKPEQKTQHDEKAAQIRHLENQVKFWTDKGNDPMVADLNAQLEKLKDET